METDILLLSPKVVLYFLFTAVHELQPMTRLTSTLMLSHHHSMKEMNSRPTLIHLHYVLLNKAPGHVVMVMGTGNCGMCQ